MPGFSDAWKNLYYGCVAQCFTYGRAEGQGGEAALADVKPAARDEQAA